MPQEIEFDSLYKPNEYFLSICDDRTFYAGQGFS